MHREKSGTWGGRIPCLLRHRVERKSGRDARGPAGPSTRLSFSRRPAPCPARTPPLGRDERLQVWTSHPITKGGSPGTQAFHAIAYDPVDNVFVFVTDYNSGRHTWAYRLKR